MFFLRTAVPIEAVVRQLRRFVRVAEGQRSYFFRFCDPKVLQRYFAAICDDAGYLAPWFTRLGRGMVFGFVGAGFLTTVALGQTMDDPATGSPVTINREALAYQHAMSEIQTFSLDRGIAFDQPGYDRFAYDYAAFTDTDLQAIALLHGFFKIQEHYDPTELPDETRRVLTEERLRKLLFFKTQGVPYGM